MQLILRNNTVGMHETPESMEMQTVLARMYGGYNVRPGWMYPQSPYGKGRVQSLSAVRGPGLGAFNPPARPVWIDPGYPPDAAIVAQNTANNDAYQSAMDRAEAQNNYDACMQNAQNANSPQQYAEVVARCNGQYNTQAAPDVPTLPQYLPQAPAPAPTYTPTAYTPTPGVYGTEYGGGGSGSISFRTSTGNTATLKPGDTWRIDIHGAANSPVVVTGGQNGRSDTTRMGSTDGSGNWSATGSIDTGQIGTWNQSWTVAGQSVGTIAFTVVAATQGQQSSNTGKANASVPPTDTTVPGNSGIDKTADKLPGGGPLKDGSNQPAPADNTMLYLVAAGIAAVVLLGKR